MNFLLLLLAISAFLGAMISVAIVTFLTAALIWHFSPESAIGRWIIDTFIEPVFVNVERAIKVGDCISPKTNMIGAKNGAV
jgi:hypothetical protein